MRNVPPIPKKNKIPKHFRVVEFSTLEFIRMGKFAVIRLNPLKHDDAENIYLFFFLLSLSRLQRYHLIINLLFPC